MDRIVIKKLCVRSSLTSGPKPIYQPILVSVFIPTDVTPAATSDDISRTINYAQLAAEINKRCDQQCFPTLLHLAEAVNKICPAGANKLIAEQPRGFFRASSLGLELTNFRAPSGSNHSSVYAPHLKYFIHNLQLSTIIGINPEERLEKQFVILNLKFGQTSATLYEIAIHVAQLVESSSFGTLETLTLHIVNDFHKTFEPTSEVTVETTKSKALTFADGAGVEVTRRVPNSTPFSKSGLDETLAFPHVAFVAFGSNIEPRIQFITQALKTINCSANMKILGTSFLYESLPMYYEAQAKFYNGVIKVNTNLPPMELMEALQLIQRDIGRKKGIENGPREIDLDILFYDDVILNTNRLTIPHSKLHEREFVLRPFLDLEEDFSHPVLKLSVKEMLDSILSTETSSLQKVLPFSQSSSSSTHWVWNSKTFVMGILNTSPDSFSAPGITDLELAAEAGLRMESDGVDMIDIGAVTRRPGAAEDLSTAEEIEKLVPLIRLLRERGCKVPISVDVFKSAVAEAVIEAGADVINDVGMGVRDPTMIPMAAKLGVPIIFMHTRGSPMDMHTFTSYKNDDVVSGVIEELHEVTERAMRAGIPRWNIIIDPGIGFAKTAEQNMEILRNLEHFHCKDSPLFGYPILLACSKKKFIGTVTGVDEASQRGPGSMAATAACISVGIDIIRVHDIPENIQVAKFADSFWRVKTGVFLNAGGEGRGSPANCVRTASVEKCSPKH